MQPYLKNLLLLCGMLAAMAVALFSFLRIDRPSEQPELSRNPPTSPPKVEENIGAGTMTSVTSGQRTAPAPSSVAESQSPLPKPAEQPVAATPRANFAAIPKEAALNLLTEYSSTYDPRQLPNITPYLNHPDRELRQAAVTAVVTLGDVSGGALLRKAAESLEDPAEIKEIMDWAKYVELPPGRFTPKLKQKK